MTSTVSVREGQEDALMAVSPRGATTSKAEPLEPRGADVLASGSPFDARSIEQAIDRFLEELAGLDLGSQGFRQTAGTMTGIIAIAVVIFSAEAIRRRSRKPGDEVSEPTDGDEGAVFPGLPGRRQRWALEAL